VLIFEDSIALVFVEDKMEVFSVGFFEEIIWVEIAGYFGYFNLFVYTKYFGHSAEYGG
jgi:hypothetical protein